MAEEQAPKQAKKPALYVPKAPPSAPAPKPAIASASQAAQAAPAAAQAKDLPSAMTPTAGPQRGVSGLLRVHGGLQIGFEDEMAANIEVSRAIGLIVEGPKGSGKSCNLILGLPIPPEGHWTYVISFDETTREALEKRASELGMTYDQLKAKHKIKLAEPCRRHFKKLPDGTVKKIYDGFDPNNTVTGEVVIGTTMALLEKIEQRNDGWSVILDHFQALWENVGVTKGRHDFGFDPAAKNSDLGKNALGVYESRARNCKLIEAKARRVAKGFFALSGYGDEERTTVEETGETGPDGRHKTRITKDIVPPKWLASGAASDIARNYHARLKFDHTRESETRKGESNDHFWVEVMDSKLALFPPGQRRDITDRDISVFFEALPKDAAMDTAIAVAEKQPAGA
jgi:hypothetical protein